MDTLVDFLLNFHGPTPYFLVFGILLLCGLGIPIPEDITLFAGAVLAYYGIADVYLMILVSFVGVMVGDSFIFWLGSKYGRKLTKKGVFAKLLPEDRLDLVRKRLDKQGNKLIFFARFMPGFRAPIFFSAGTLHLPFKVFFFYDGLAALISVPAIVGLIYYFGDSLDWIVRIIQRAEYGIVIVIFSALFAVIGKWYITHRKLKRIA
jgi:membrane protein DedA with SNARE-associated domain